MNFESVETFVKTMPPALAFGLGWIAGFLSLLGLLCLAKSMNNGGYQGGPRPAPKDFLPPPPPRRHNP